MRTDYTVYEARYLEGITSRECDTAGDRAAEVAGRSSTVVADRDTRYYTCAATVKLDDVLHSFG